MNTVSRHVYMLFVLCLAVGTLTASSPGKATPDIPKLTCTDFVDDFIAPAYLSNGLIGLRPGPNPLLSAKTVVSGFVRDYLWEPFESFAPAPYPLRTDIVCEGVSLLKRPDLVNLVHQTLDMANGELTTEMLFKPTGEITLEIEVLQFLSRTTPCLVLQEIKITPSKKVEFMLRSVIEKLPPVRNELGISLVDPTRQKFEGDPNKVSIFRTIVAMVSETYHPEPHLQAKRMMGWASMLGFDSLRERNRVAWSELWKSRIKVSGDSDAQKALDVAFFYLHSSVHSSCITGVPPFGMSRVRGYFGHVFWDMDHWMLHAVLPVAPDAAKAMIDFRRNGLENAKKVARLFGFKGAQYPWEAGIIGQEVTPTRAHTGWAEHHVTACVGLAAWEYAIATEDQATLHESAWPVLREIAVWIESRGIWTKKGFEIADIVGADENQEGTRNNVHMNVLCKMVMDAAVKCAMKVGYTPPAIWSKISNELVLPVDPERKIVVQFDGANPEPGGDRYAPGMLQILFYHDPMEYDAISQDLYKKTYEFEEKLRVKLPSHPSNPVSPRAPGFTTPPFAACAAFFGFREKAAEQFRHAWEKYWVEPFGITKEYQSFREGEYLMNHAALLQAAMYGFTGLRIRQGEWTKYNATLPEGWTKIEIDRIWIRGEPMKLVAEHGKKAKLTSLNEQ